MIVWIDGVGKSHVAAELVDLHPKNDYMESARYQNKLIQNFHIVISEFEPKQ